MTRLKAGAATDTGQVRSNNEDNLLVSERLFAVADGMGGHSAGEVASQVAIDALRVAFNGDPSIDGLVEAVRRANEAVLAKADDDPELGGMGTTLTAVALVPAADGEELVVVNVGDSRTYLLRQGELNQLTEDDSLVGQLVRDGQIDRREARRHPQRNIVTKALGLEGRLDVDPLQLIPVEGERLLLCSDGLSDEVDEDEIASILRQNPDPQNAARALVEVANERGGRDNITVVVIDVVDDGNRAESASDLLATLPPQESGGRMLSREARNAQLRELADDDGGRDETVLDDRVDEHWDAQRGPAEELDEPRRPITGRVIVFVLVLLLIVGGAFAAIGYTARGTYYVGLDGERVTIFKGRPGGLLWFRPTVEEATDLTADDVRATRLDDLRSGKEQPTLSAAREYVENLRDERSPATTTTTTAPSTTVPAAPPPAPTPTP